MDEAEIHRILTRVLASGIVAPGARLGEQSLADLFAISRDRMRRVLQRLGHERKLELVPNRGARAINPGLSDARTVYEARRILEGGIVLAVAERISDADLDQLGAQHAEEQAALRSGDTARVFQLGGALHMFLGELAGNQIIVEALRNMVDRTSSLLTFFGPSDGPACSCREHGTIIAALQKRDPLMAREAMCTHLSLVETRLRTRPRCDAVDIETLIRAEIAKVNR